MRSFAPILLSLSLSLHAFATHGVNHAHRHADVALRPRQSFEGERMTYYDITTGVTACGQSYTANDFVVAVNHPQFGSGQGSSPLCFQTISISFQGKSTTAQIVDECMGCPYGGLDLTEGLFTFLAGGLGAGVISGDWSIGGAPAPAKVTTTSTKPPPPSPTYQYKPPTTTPQTTSSSPPPSSSSTSTSTTSKTHSSVSSATSTTSQHSSTTSSPTQTSSATGYDNAAASSLAQPSGTISTDGQSQSIDSLYQVIISLGGIVIASNP